MMNSRLGLDSNYYAEIAKMIRSGGTKTGALQERMNALPSIEDVLGADAGPLRGWRGLPPMPGQTGGVKPSQPAPFDQVNAVSQGMMGDLASTQELPDPMANALNSPPRFGF